MTFLRVIKPNYVIIPLLVIIVSVVGSFFTSQGVNDWYQTLKLPSWTPSGEVIGLVWTVIFVLTAISALIFWNTSRKTSTFGIIVLIFLVNGFLNILWSYIFFDLNLILVAFFEAILLCLSTVALIILLWPVSKTASLLLFPYAAWVGFASYLTLTIWQLNFA